MIGHVFRATETYTITGRGLVVAASTLSGNPDGRPVLPLKVRWTDPRGTERSALVKGIEQFAKFLGQPITRGEKVGLLIPECTSADFETGTVMYTLEGE